MNLRIMKSIQQSIIDLCQSDWDYYYDVSKVMLSNPFSGKISHTDFIKNYFRRSGKGAVLELIDIGEKEIFKSAHTNSIFFIGILIYKNTIFKRKYFLKMNNDGYYEFPFIWFLVCLFHDFAMQLENSGELLKRIVDIDTLNKTYSIKHKLLEKRVTGVSKLLFSYIRQYFHFRRFSHKKIDHGILGGLYFYDRLESNRIIKELENNSELYWGKEISKRYAQAAAVIATHNIWFPTENTASDYISFGMMGLINAKPISLKQSPLLFLLGLVDTIDPIKTYDSEFDVDYIVKNLLLDFNSNEMIIEKNVNSKLDFDKIVIKSNSLKNWLNVEIKQQTNRLEIKFR